MGYITEEGLKNLKTYKYVSGGYSFLDKILNHWWEFFIKLIPMVSNKKQSLNVSYMYLERRTKPDHIDRVDH